MFLGAALAVGGAYGLGCALTRRIHCSWAVRFCTGAAALSLLVFSLMSVHWAHPPVLAAVSVGCAALVLLQPPSIHIPRMPWWAAALFAIYGALYLANAAAPEVETDPNVYHLTPAREALRHGGFSQEIGFYDRLPHAIELLFAIAFPFGGAPATKLVHFSFLIASVPLIMSMAPSVPGYVAALLYFLAPVVAASGTAAFNDAALVAALLASVVVLRQGGPAWVAGMLAGFCYGIKMTGGIAIPIGLVWLAWQRRWRDAVVFGLIAAALMAPWLLRNWFDTGNPFAPFLNRWFPNPWFHLATEQELVTTLRTYGVNFWQRWPEVLWGWRLQGMIGPVFLAAVLALRGRKVFLVLALVCSLPWWMNAGSRFLMPALPFVSLGMATAAPAGVLYGLLAVHAATVWPQALDLYSPKTWRMSAYPGRESWDKRVAEMVASHTSPEDRIYDLHGVHAAHVDRRFTLFWQSAETSSIMQSLVLARELGPGQLYQFAAEFDRRQATAVRVRLQGTSVIEIEFRDGEFRIPNRTRWSLRASPNPWQAPLALDRNLATRWTSGERLRGDEEFTIDFEGSETLTSVIVTGTHHDGLDPAAIELRNLSGNWTEVPASGKALPAQDLRKQGIEHLQRAGYTHIVARAGFEGPGQVGYDLANDAGAWGVEVLANLDTVYLFRVRR